jgi:hypothetical protein
MNGSSKIVNTCRRNDRIDRSDKASRVTIAQAHRGEISRPLWSAPFLIVPSILIFAWGNPRFVGEANIVNMLQQGVYLLLAAVAQLLVLIAGGFDLSVGSNIALTSIVSSSLMVAVQQAYPGRRVAGRSCWIRGDARGGRLRRNLQCGRRRPSQGQSVHRHVGDRFHIPRPDASD